MCALFVRDETVLRPRYLHLFLSATCEELLVPLMCGATNVTMDSSHLSDVLVPVPQRSVQNEIVESHLIQTRAQEMVSAAESLRQESMDQNVLRITARLVQDIQELTEATKARVGLACVLPK